MTRLSYTSALDLALQPLGFTRVGRDWKRIRGEIQDWVNLQKSWVDGSITVNLFAKNLETERILESIPCDEDLGVVQFGKRIGELIDGRDRWWKSVPDWVKNQPWNIKAMPEGPVGAEMHGRLTGSYKGKPQFNAVER